MIIFANMKERLLEFLKSENKSSAQLADEIGVQPSGISHILSGRNNPSLDFVLKMLEKYQFLSTDWLLFGKGPMYKDPQMQSLFGEENIFNSNIDSRDSNENAKNSVNSSNEQVFRESPPLEISEKVKSKSFSSGISKIVMFYDDNSFEEYLPR
jgi:transcriptional regulator with XRE-family HTH domain